MDVTQERPPEPLWYRVQLDRNSFKNLQRRTNRHGLVFFGCYLLGLAVFGFFTVSGVLPVWARVVSFLLYATVFAFSEPILHETHHRTPFSSTWLNESVHYVAGVLTFKEPIRDRWLHAAHHTYTSYPDIDPEIFLEPPPQVKYLFIDFFRLRYVLLWVMATIRNAIRPDALTRRFVPPSEYLKVKWSSRACLAVYVATIGCAIGFHTWWPILFLFVARFIGAPLHAYLSMPQHAGLAMGVADWRLSTRTVLMSPLNRLLFWNMGFHLEHHMNPIVPFHALPKLHIAMQHDCPAPSRSTWAAWSEMVPALWRQRHDLTYLVPRPLPSTIDVVKDPTTL